MDMTSSEHLARAVAQQTTKNEVVLNAAYIDGEWMAIEARSTNADIANSDKKIAMIYMIQIQEKSLRLHVCVLQRM